MLAIAKSRNILGRKLAITINFPHSRVESKGKSNMSQFPENCSETNKSF